MIAREGKSVNIIGNQQKNATVITCFTPHYSPSHVITMYSVTERKCGINVLQIDKEFFDTQCEQM